MEKWQIAYIAGIIDGEGCTSICKDLRGPRRNPIYYARIEVKMNSYHVCEFIQKFFGGNIGVINRGENYRTMYHWYIAGTCTLPVLQAIQPFLLDKYERVQTIIAFLTGFKKLTHADLAEKEYELARREHLYQKVCLFNQKGEFN